MKQAIRLRESELRRMIAQSVKRMLRESTMDDAYSDFDDTAYDRNGNEIHKGNIVVWTDPETGRKAKYEVYEEPSSEMVKLWSEYGECEAFPEECLVIR